MCGKYTLFYEVPKNWGYYAHTQTLCTRPLLGGKGPGDEANKCNAKHFTSAFSKISEERTTYEKPALCSQIVAVFVWIVLLICEHRSSHACMLNTQLFNLHIPTMKLPAELFCHHHLLYSLRYFY